MMYIYRLSHGYEEENREKTIGYFGSWKKARNVMKEYRSSLPDFFRKGYIRWFKMQEWKGMLEI